MGFAPKGCHGWLLAMGAAGHSSHFFSYHFASRSALQVLQKRGGESQSSQARISSPQSWHEMVYHLDIKFDLVNPKGREWSAALGTDFYRTFCNIAPNVFLRQTQIKAKRSFIGF